MEHRDVARTTAMSPGLPRVGREGAWVGRTAPDFLSDFSLPSHPGIGPLPSILARFLARTRPAGDRMSEMGAEGAMPDLAPEPSRDRTAPFDSRTVSRADRSLAAHPSLCAVSRARFPALGLSGCPILWQGLSKGWVGQRSDLNNF